MVIVVTIPCYQSNHEHQDWHSIIDVDLPYTLADHYPLSQSLMTTSLTTLTMNQPPSDSTVQYIKWVVINLPHNHHESYPFYSWLRSLKKHLHNYHHWFDHDPWGVRAGDLQRPRRGRLPALRISLGSSAFSKSFWSKSEDLASGAGTSWANDVGYLTTFSPGFSQKWWALSVKCAWKCIAAIQYRLNMMKQIAPMKITWEIIGYPYKKQYLAFPAMKITWKRSLENFTSHESSPSPERDR